MERLAKHLLVISFDAISKKDVAYISKLKNFKSFIEKSSYSMEVESVNPSLTYPAHTSIITGAYPIRHGIFTNTKLQINRIESPDWYWHRREIKEDCLYDIARRNKMTVSAQLWPVTAKAKIKYNFPEIFPNRPYENQLTTSLSNGSPLYQLRLFSKYGKDLKGIEQPYLDNFVHKGLLYTIRRYKPDLMLAHFTDIDSLRHYYGHDSDQARMALDRHDQRLGEIIETLKEEGIYEDTTIIILGDHAHIPAENVVSINKLFEEKGFLKTKGENIESWDAICKANDGSAYIYCKSPEIRTRVKDLLEEFKESSPAVKTILNREEIIGAKMQNDADFLLDGADGYYFTDSLEDRVISPVEKVGERVKKGYQLSSHGYLAKRKDYETIFMVSGKHIKENYDIGPMTLVDEGPTMARILGLNMEGVDGRVLEEIFIRKKAK